MYVNLSKLPSPKTQYQTFLRDFSGGLNLRRASTEIADNQSPSMSNLLWEGGCLKRRPGQRAVAVEDCDAFLSQCMHPIAMHDKPIGGKLLFAYADIDNNYAIAYCTFSGSSLRKETITTISRDAPSIPTNDRKGCFFAYGEHVYFKGVGCYKKISIEEDGTLSASDVVPYTPVIQLNTNPATGIGDLYQPENRLSSQKEIWFNADSGVRTTELLCDGNSVVFTLPYKGGTEHQSLLSVINVYVGAELLDPATDYAVNIGEGKITLNEAPPASLKVTVTYALLMSEYTLPDPLCTVDEVWVKNLNTGKYDLYTDRSGIQNVEDPDPGKGDFILDAAKLADNTLKLWIRFCDPNGITQYEGASITDPNALNSFVKVKYSRDNSNALKAIEECHIATTYGSGGLEANCIVMAGAKEQTNAFFWSGNDSVGGNPGYFPIINYNLAGEFYDPITAFGRQQNKLVVFQNARIGSATFSLDEVDGRMVVSLPYRTINDRIGCDLPGSVQLVDNNLVWAHSKHGVMYLKDSTYAYETLVVCISENINDVMLSRMQRKVSLGGVSSIDDGKRYWLFHDIWAYVWDYSIQGYTANTEKLSWYPMSGMKESAVSSACISGSWVRIDFHGNIFQLDPNYGMDFEENISCFLRTKDFHFGTYAYRKNVEKAILVFPRVEGIKARISYETDLEPRTDIMDIQINYDETSDIGAFVKVRAPKCKHIHTFAVEVNSIDNAPFELTAMQIFYTFTGNQTIKAGQRM